MVCFGADCSGWFVCWFGRLLAWLVVAAAIYNIRVCVSFECKSKNRYTTYMFWFRCLNVFDSKVFKVLLTGFMVK